MDHALFFEGDSHQAALLKLQYVVENRLGAGLLAGGFGQGKTYLTTLLEEKLRPVCGSLVRVLYPRLSPVEFLSFLAAELQVHQPPRAEQAPEESTSQPVSAVQLMSHTTMDQILRQIMNQLIDRTKYFGHTVIVVDDAHLVEDAQVLQALQMLLNFQHRPDIDFTLILLGEPTLLGQLQRVPQLNQQIVVKSLLQPFTESETERYITHRLSAAGCDRNVFSSEAITRLFTLSHGIARTINGLCDLALLVGYADALSEITAEEVDAVAQELAVAVPA